MFCCRAVLLLGLLGSAVWAAAAQQANPKAGGPKAPKANPETPPIQVVVQFSVSELDPKDPKDSYLECLVRNRGKVAVRVPTVYNAGFDRDMILKGDAAEKERWGLWLVSWHPKPPKQQLAALEPGKELSVFKAALKDILLLDPKAKKPEHRWEWEA
jgi:hypothetical protein